MNGAAKTLVDILTRLAGKDARQYQGDFSQLEKELGLMEQTTRDIGQTMGSSGRISRITTGNVLIDQLHGVWVTNPHTGKTTVALEPTGDLFAGLDVSLPGSTSFSVFSESRNYNGEPVGEGDLLLGDNSSGMANLFWDRSEGRLLFRGGLVSQAYIDTDGTLHAQDATLAGSITAGEGTIGGWTITPTSIQKDGIVLDSAADQIRSSNFQAGYSGFSIYGASGDAEFNNISARGILRSAVFEYDTVSAVSGNLVVLDGDVLAEDMTQLDTSALAIEGNTTFQANDILQIKDGVNEEWMRVTSAKGGGGYNVTRDLAGSYPANQNPAWSAGAAVINYGVSGEGGLLMSSTLTGAPYLDIFTHAGAPWTTTTLKTRLGNLAGITDPALSPSGYGLYSDNVFLKGTLVAGSGSVTLDPSGLKILEGSGTNNSIRWVNPSDETYSQLYVTDEFGYGLIMWDTHGADDQNAQVGIYASALDSVTGLKRNFGISMTCNRVHSSSWGSFGQLMVFGDGHGTFGGDLNISPPYGLYVGGDGPAPDNSIVAAGSITAETSLYAGISDSTQGLIVAWGGPAGGEGGELRLYVNQDYDTNIAYWVIDSWQDDIRIYGSSGGASLRLSYENILYASGSVSVTNDIFVAGGLMVGVTSGSPADGGLYYEEDLHPYRDGAWKTAYTYIPIGATPWTSTSFDGDAKNVGTYAVDVSTFTGAPASTAHIKAYNVRLRVKWAAAADGTYASMLQNSTDTYSALTVNSQVANISTEGNSIVPADASGDMDLKIVGANATAVFIQIYGYFV